jgi:hypothetical protein
MINEENKTLLEIKKEAWEAGFERALKLVEANRQTVGYNPTEPD